MKPMLKRAVFAISVALMTLAPVGCVETGPSYNPPPAASAPQGQPPDSEPQPVESARPEFFSCQQDSDCIAVPKAECCPHGYKIAVNRNMVDQYHAEFACREAPQVCAQFMINDMRVAHCNRSSQMCEMISPGEIKCGGFIRNAPQCPDGYVCVHTKNPDFPGSCVKQTR